MSVNDTKIGKFMVAIGSIIENSQTGNILLLKRTDPFHFGEWEVPYGRLDQHEEILDGLSREVFEETGLTEFKVARVLRLWHIYRGEKKAENEVFGTTFHIQVTNPKIILSDEHSEYSWVTPTTALELIKVKGIRADVAHFIETPLNNASQVMIADTHESVVCTLPTVQKYQPIAKK